MKFSDVIKVVNAYDDTRWSPSRMNVIYGCDCGCGGDSYTEESWGAEEEAATEAIYNAKAFCESLGIEYDGEEA